MNSTLVESAVKEHGVQLKYILSTHHHYDHCGLNENLVNRISTLKWPPVRVYGGDDRIPALTDKIGDGDTITLGAHTIKCIFTPCHTTGHICYYLETSGGDRAVFTGIAIKDTQVVSLLFVITSSHFQVIHCSVPVAGDSSKEMQLKCIMLLLKNYRNYQTIRRFTVVTNIHWPIWLFAVILNQIILTLKTELNGPRTNEITNCQR